MNILFYRYNSIYEPDCISAFQSFGLRVIEERAEMDHKLTKPSDTVKIVADHILHQIEIGEPIMFVFSINFYPAISDVCEKFHVLYACWSVDCPVVELFFNQVRNSYNRIFLFDYAQYERIHPYNPDGTFYLPLATNVERLDQTISTICEADRQKFSADISFVGSLYNEKNPLNKMDLDEFTKGYIDGLVHAQRMIYGCNFTEEALPDSIVEKLKGTALDKCNENLVEPLDRYVAAHSYVGMQIAEVERRDILNMLAKDFKVDLYTQSDVSDLVGVNVKGAAKSLSEMPKIFHLSKINLNITMRPIQTGLSLRVFDVLGSGGFLLTNYQSEIPEIFEVGKDLEVYTSLDELYEKCAYYLQHEEERAAIAKNGYEKVKQYHTCKARMEMMIKMMMGE